MPQFTPYVPQLLRYLDSGDIYLRLSAAAALATLGNYEGETVLASELAHGERRRQALYFTSEVYIHGNFYSEYKVKQLLASLYESGRRRYLGLLVVLRAILTGQPYKSPDGQILKSGYIPHPSSRRLLPMVEEMIHKLDRS